MTLAIHASTPACKAMPALAANGTVASNTFSPPGGSDCIIALCVAADGPATGPQTISQVTDSIGTLTWAILTGGNAVVARSNGASVAGSEIGGTTEVWIAACPSAQTNMSVTAKVSAATGGTSPDGLILPIVFTGASATQTGNVAIKNNTTPAAPSLALAGTTAGNQILGIILNYANGTAPTVPAGQTTTINGVSSQQLNVSGGDGYWVQIQTALSAGGSVTINDTAPSIDANIVVVEIQAGAAGGGTLSIGVTGDTTASSESVSAPFPSPVSVTN